MSVVLNVAEAGPCRKEIRIEVPVAAVESETARILKEFVRKAAVPGFRKGKVPEPLVRRHFGPEIHQQLLDRLVPRYFRQAVAELSLEPLLSPRYRDVEFAEDQPLRFVAEVEVRPEVELRNYRDLALPDLETEPPIEEVERFLRRVQRSVARFQVVEREARDGDRVTCRVRRAGAEDAGPDRVEVLDLPADAEGNELERAARGLAAGASRRFAVGEGEERQELELTVDKVEEAEEPRLDDEFARSYFEKGSLEELRDHVRERLRRELLEARRVRRERAAVEQLAERHEVELSDRLLEVEAQRILEDYAHSLLERGVRLEDPKIPWAELENQARSQAARNLKVRFVLDAIAEREGLEVSEEEFERHLAAEARKAGTSPHALRHRWHEEGVLAEARQGLRRRKVLAWLTRSESSEAS